MVKLELLSPNLITVLETMLSNTTLVKYLNYDKADPLAEPDLPDAKAIMFSKLFPFPFNQFTTTTDATQVHVYFASVTLKDRVVEDGMIYFDVVVAKNLWLINTGEPKIRAYEIVSQIVSIFDGASIGTLGRLEFLNFRHLAVNERFDALQLVARVTSYAK